MRNTIRIAIVSEHALYRHAVAELLRQRGSHVVETSSPLQLRGKLLDTVVIDLEHASGNTSLLVRQAHQASDAYVVLIGSAVRIAASINHHAHAELETSRADATTLAATVHERPPKPSAELHRMHRLWGEVTPRQRDVLRWLALGFDNPGIADRLDIGERAVKAHVSALLELFGLRSRTQLALLANDAGQRASGR
ncbi:MAG TPA: LuxR C-terminal-related transcriptional regulator [Kofleriaceae bacterium]|nr:LuxR C-terminal-related transcriptional regulator [Kofleriaceae bacterium]